MTLNDYLEKWNIRFADNDDFEIDAQDLREFKDDTAQLLATTAGAGAGLTELVLPMAVVPGAYYVTSTGIWTPRSSFNASAAPVAGPNWRRVASFTQVITAASISDASEAGRLLLTTAGAAAQLALLDNLTLAGYPNLARVYGEAGAVKYLLDQVKQLTQAVAAIGAPVPRPAAPSGGAVDDQGDTFSFLPTAAYPSFAQYKVAGLPNTTGAEWLSPATCYVQNERVYVRVVGAVAKGALAVYVGSSGNVPDGQVLTNADPFTANNVVPAVPGALAVGFSVDNAALSPGDALHFTAKASGGTAPYQHSVQALNPETGTVTVLGTASTASYNGTWPAVPAGIYLVTDALSDAAGSSLVSPARRVVVSLPGSGSFDPSKYLSRVAPDPQQVASDLTLAGNVTFAATIPAPLRTYALLAGVVQALAADPTTKSYVDSKLATKADLDGSGKVPAAQLPSYVDDVLEYDTVAQLPQTGEQGKIYVITTGSDVNKQLRWAGSQYVTLVSSPGSTDAVPEGTSNLYFQEARVLATKLAGYAKATASRALTAADSLLVALGVLEKKADDNAAAIALRQYAYAGTRDVYAYDSSNKAYLDASYLNKVVPVYPPSAGVAVKVYLPPVTDANLGATIALRGSASDSISIYSTSSRIGFTLYGRAALAVIDYGGGSYDWVITQLDQKPTAGGGFTPVTSGDGTKYLNDKGTYTAPPSSSQAVDLSNYYTKPEADARYQQLAKSRLEIVLNADSVDSQSVTPSVSYTYTGKQISNLDAVKVNGQDMALPLPMTAGTTYVFDFVRTTSAQAAVLVLTN